MDIKLSLLEQLLPLILPVLVAGVVRFFQRLPKWAIPVIVLPGLGMAGQWIAAAMQGTDANPVAGLLLAAAAMFVREVTNQLGQAGRAMTRGERVPRVGDRKEDRFGGPTLSGSLRGIG